MIENFEKLSFERKIDVLVAMHVFNMKDIIIVKHKWEYMGEEGVSWLCYSKYTGNHVPCYSTLLTLAWDIVRKFDGYVYLFKSKEYNDGKWECKLRSEDRVMYYWWAETEMLAICYAGLKAVGYDIKTFLQEEEKI